VCSNGEEVIAIADLRYLIGRISEYIEALGLGGVQVTSEHESPFSRQHEHIACLDVKRVNLVFDGEPAIALHDRDKFDLVGRRESQRPRTSSYQDAHFHAPGTRQSQNVCERVAFHS
jgi:hypothetical protein